MSGSSTGPSQHRHRELHADDLALFRHVVRIADQLPGDWSYMGALETGQEGDDAYRFQLSAMTLMLATVQYHHTPAYRELCKPAIEKMIEKMMRFDTWSYWELSSKGGLADDPDLTQLGEGWVNPVERKNVMYSGHLLNMINLHEMFYREGKFSTPGALKFEFKPLFRGMGPETFEYSEQDIVDTIRREFKANDYLGCECEPNLIFPYCNQYPILAFMLHDHIHGSSIARDIMERHTRAWLADGGNLYADQIADLAQLPLMHFVKQGFTVPSAALAAGLAVMLHPWKASYAEDLYEKVKAHLVKEEADGTLSVDQVVDIESVAQQGIDPAVMGVSTFGFVLLAAQEMGDHKTARGLLDFADKNLNPVRRDGCLHYERSDDFGSAHYATRLTTNGMIPWARVNPPDGLRQMYNAPWSEDQVNGPEIVDIDYPRVLVSRAFYDEDDRSLTVALRRGSNPPDEASFRVVHRRPGTGEIRVMVDGQPLPSSSDAVRPGPEGLQVTVPLEKSADIQISL